MNKRKNCRRGITLLIVIGVLLLVMVFVAVILAIIENQAKHTKHQVERIKAYYTALAGVYYAIDRIETWTICPSCTYSITPVDTTLPYQPTWTISDWITIPNIGRVRVIKTTVSY